MNCDTLPRHLLPQEMRATYEVVRTVPAVLDSMRMASSVRLYRMQARKRRR